ncbi:hypothetical protein BN14_04234 [Rhizoctonia solani AG-1 IB]|uniref:Uncharacterized protein n=1 Tax=Thanatephorus cucumeris (strain AG1-IB / isolate 7/3/14) TaxID=1108050 RepID=M5BUN6_THACB|nr:hypothetical protein BN14_04234 [Rhizoctonia solani AG-1 IB]
MLTTEPHYITHLALFIDTYTSDIPRKRATQEAPREITDASDSSHVYGTDTSASQSIPGARSDIDDEPMFIQHEDAGAIFPPQPREVIELPPGYDQLPRPPPARAPQQVRPLPVPSQHPPSTISTSSQYPPKS